MLGRLSFQGIGSAGGLIPMSSERLSLYDRILRETPCRIVLCARDL